MDIWMCDVTDGWMDVCVMVHLTIITVCCRYGMVKPPKLREAPQLLKTLLSEDSPVARKFRDNIRTYNNLLSFASKGISGKLFENGKIVLHIICFTSKQYIYYILKNLYNNVLYLICYILGPGRRGPPLYKMTGQIYHCLTNMFPNDDDIAAFSQLYVHDNQEDHRLLQNRNPEVKPIFI